MDAISFLQILVTAPIGMLLIAPLFASQRRSASLTIVLAFAVLFVIKHIYLLEKCDFFEATWRSALFASIPIVVGYLWARYVFPRVLEEREFLSAVPNLKKQKHAPALAPTQDPQR
jgi:predicted ABC-type exoprotein transport system permease subunit